MRPIDLVSRIFLPAETKVYPECPRPYRWHDATWVLARKLHNEQSRAFGFGAFANAMLAPAWDELSFEDRIDWWIAADKELNPGSYKPRPVEPFARGVQ